MPRLVLTIRWRIERGFGKSAGSRTRNFEKVKGSGKWCIRYTGADGKRHEETVGRHGDAIDLVAKRRHEKLWAKKLPEKVNSKNVTFGELTKDALLHSREENGERAEHDHKIKLGFIGPDFNDRVARNIKKGDIQSWLLTRWTNESGLQLPEIATKPHSH